MFKESNKKESVPVEPTGKPDLNGFSLSKDLEANIQMISTIFEDDDTIIVRNFQNQKNKDVSCCIFFIDGMINNSIINEYIIQPIVSNKMLAQSDNTLGEIKGQVITCNDVKQSQDLSEIMQSILYGDTILFVDGFKDALIINSKGWEYRAVEEPDTEKSLRGPREGFNESILLSTSLIRRKIRTSDLKFKFRNIGTRSNTQVCICYLKSLADEKVLDELNKRLDSIDIDALLDSNYIAEYIKDAPYSPFKTVGISEKPDVIAGKLLEGRIAIIVDGSPVVLTVPFLIIENFQTADDYYLNFYFASIARILRILGFFLSISVPAVYVSLVTYHREMLPTPLALSIAQARQGVPLPTFVECFVMLLVFEIIRETGIRMPSNVGQALSVVGALVIGQAAVQAKFISAPMVIIVALTAITGLINQQIQGISILSRFALLCVSGIMGLYGYMFGIIILIIHLLGVRSFGVDYTSQMLAYNSQGMKDIYVRSFWKKMKTRPYFETKDNVRNGEPDKT